MAVLCLFLLLLVFMFLGVPIAISLGLSGAMSILMFSQDSLSSLAIKLFETSDAYTFLAIPFFLLSGAFMTTGGVAQRLIDFANACVGHIRGGLAIAAVLACMLFAALSGSSPATVAAVGSIAVAGMVRSGYPKEFGAGIICNAGTLGILIPPSIVMVVYSAATETSVGKLFMAGVIPGLLLGLMLMIAIYIVARIKKLPAQPRATFSQWLGCARRAFWGLLLLVIILGGIYSGMFTPTEAAAVAAVYSAFVALFVYKDMRLRGLPQSTAGVWAPVDHADVHHRQRHAVCPCPDHRADPAGNHGLGHFRRADPDWLFADGQRGAIDRWQFYGAIGDCADPGADLLPDCDEAGHRPDSPGDCDGGEHGDRPGAPTRRVEPVRDLGGDRPDPGPDHPRRDAVVDDPVGVPDPGDVRAIYLTGAAGLVGDVAPRPNAAPSPYLISIKGSLATCHLPSTSYSGR